MSLDLSLLLEASLIGLSIAAPVGPIALLILQRTLVEGPSIGLAAGLGCAAADGGYALLAAFGLVAVSAFLGEYAWWIRFAGGLFLLYLGLRIAWSRPDLKAAAAGIALERRRKLGPQLGAFVTTFLLTLSNPLTIVSFLAVFASLGVAASGAPGAAATVVVGVLLGSLTYQWSLVLVAALMRRRLAGGLLLWINRASGVAILCFAVLLLWRAFQ